MSDCRSQSAQDAFYWQNGAGPTAHRPHRTGCLVIWLPSQLVDWSAGCQVNWLPAQSATKKKKMAATKR